MHSTRTIIHPPTCSVRPDGSCCAAEGSLVCSCPGTSSWARWSAVSSRHRLGPCRSRRAARSCTACRCARRTDAGPCGSASCCSFPAIEAASVRAAALAPVRGCRWRCSWSVAACSFRSGCRLWWRPGRGCMGGWDQSSAAALFQCQNVCLREKDRKDKCYGGTIQSGCEGENVPIWCFSSSAGKACT